MFSRVIPVLLLALAPFAHAADKAAVSVEDRLKTTLESKFPDIGVDSVRKSPYPGLYEAMLGDEMVYMSPDGKFMIYGGTMLGIEGKPVDLTQVSKAELDAKKAPMRAAELAKLDPKSMLTFAAADQKFEINVFTDIDCGYCQKLHKDVPALNQMGITVHYLAFPRSGLLDEAGQKTSSYQKLINVWCADDPQKAMTAAKNHQILPNKTCKNSLDKHYGLVRKFGLSGTPAIVLNDGQMIGGYMQPAQMLQVLQQNQQQKNDLKGPLRKVSAVN